MHAPSATQEKRRGPYPASQLLKWHTKGFFPRDFPCQHDATRAWVPLWLLAAHYRQLGGGGTAAAETATRCALSSLLSIYHSCPFAPPVSPPDKKHCPLPHLRRPAGAHPEASCETTSSTEKVAVAILTCDSDDDVDMEDMEEVMNELRHDSEYIQVRGNAEHVSYGGPPLKIVLVTHQECPVGTLYLILEGRGPVLSSQALCSAADMDVDEAAALQPSVQLPDPMDVVMWTGPAMSAAAASAESVPPSKHIADAQEQEQLEAALALIDGGGSGPGGASAGGGLQAAVPPRWRLYIVVDTNVLLSRATLRVLEQLKRRFGPGDGGTGGRGEGGGEGGGRPLEVVTIVPWMVLLELDNLKARGDGKGVVW